MRCSLVLLVALVAALPRLAPAEPSAPAPPEADAFGPLIMIEDIEVIGNVSTQTDLILRALPLRAGDVLHAGDKRLRAARYQVLALGFFRDVTLGMRKGRERGQVVLEVEVVERGTVVLNRLWFGTTDVAPYWVGADVSERNLLGLGLEVGGGFIYAANGDIDGSRDQWATEMRLGDASVLGSRFGLQGSATLVRGSEPYRVGGDPAEVAPRDLRAFSYRRFGGRAAVTYDITVLSRVSAGVRVEQLVAATPLAPTLTLPDGEVTPLDLHLERGESRVVTTGLTFDRDTRPDPILPHRGGHVVLSGELGASVLGGDYDFGLVFGRYEHYWPLLGGAHALGLKLSGGVVLGDAPRFDRIHISDVNRMLTPRALGMVLSAAAPLDIIGARGERSTYGDVGGSANLEYAFELFRGSGKNRVYGGDVFVGAGLWGLGERADLRGPSGTLPIDVYADAGVRIDTDVGVFEVTIANALGRLR